MPLPHFVNIRIDHWYLEPRVREALGTREDIIEYIAELNSQGIKVTFSTNTSFSGYSVTFTDRNENSINCDWALSAWASSPEEAFEVCLGVFLLADDRSEDWDKVETQERALYRAQMKEFAQEKRSRRTPE